MIIGHSLLVFVLDVLFLMLIMKLVGFYQNLYPVICVV